MTKIEKKKETIAKMFALAMDQQGTPEGDAAAEAAMRLMAQYDIDESEVRKEKNPMTLITIQTPRAGWVYDLCWAIGDLVGVYTMAGHGGAWFVGKQTDCEIAEYLYASLLKQCNNWVYWARGEGIVYDRYSGRTYRESWVSGLIGKIYGVLRAQREATEGDATSTAMTSVSRKAVAKNWWEDQHGKAPSAGSRDRRNYNTQAREAGASANLNTGIGGRQTRSLKA